MIEDGGVERPFELATCFVAPRPEDMGTAPFETWQHDPEAIARSKLHEALQPETADGEIGDAAFEPGFTRPPHLYWHVDIAPLR